MLFRILKQKYFRGYCNCKTKKHKICAENFIRNLFHMCIYVLQCRHWLRFIYIQSQNIQLVKGHKMLHLNLLKTWRTMEARGRVNDHNHFLTRKCPIVRITYCLQTSFYNLRGNWTDSLSKNPNAFYCLLKWKTYFNVIFFWRKVKNYILTKTSN